ncbi:hypothetical protein CWN94_11635 [Vibrio splendidus]|uniref:hypothetical protein n=1 Tax=Vibrio splendidus TaxID=29497 RepID=UPI000D3CAB79|nr:hypothetical protein [Vibrio splendidus]PTO54048.1 hypothetical protein CWN94_11635 [Vibrio splendidus]
MMFATLSAVFHYVEHDGLRIVFCHHESDVGFIEVITNDCGAMSITGDQASVLISEGCSVQFGSGCIVPLGGRVQ